MVGDIDYGGSVLCCLGRGAFYMRESQTLIYRSGIILALYSNFIHFEMQVLFQEGFLFIGVHRYIGLDDIGGDLSQGFVIGRMQPRSRKIFNFPLLVLMVP